MELTNCPALCGLTGGKMANKKYVLTTTLDLLREKNACESGYRTLLKSLGPKWPKDKPINLLRILESNGVMDLCWCLRATQEDSTIPRVLIAADFAQSVLKYFTKRYPNDGRPAKAIKAARDFAKGKITADAAYAAAYAAAADAAYDAAYAAAADAAYAAAYAAAADAAYAASYAAADAAYDAAYAAADAAYDAAYAAADAAYDAAYAAYAADDADASAAAYAAREKERAKQVGIIKRWLR